MSEQGRTDCYKVFHGVMGEMARCFFERNAKDGKIDGDDVLYSATSTVTSLVAGMLGNAAPDGSDLKKDFMHRVHGIGGMQTPKGFNRHAIHSGIRTYTTFVTDKLTKSQYLELWEYLFNAKELKGVRKYGDLVDHLFCQFCLHVNGVSNERENEILEELLKNLDAAQDYMENERGKK